MADTELTSESTAAAARLQERSERDILDLADEIGFKRPNIRQATHPQQFQQWADRVEQGLSYLEKGDHGSFEAIKAEADRYAGAASPNEGPQSLPADRSRAASRDPLADLVSRLADLRPQIQDDNPRLATTIERLVEHASHTDYVSRLHYPAHAAQALQDTERLVGRIDVDPSLRDELSRLATSTPGLKNERLQKLLEITPALADQDLVNKIRETAARVAKLPDQNSRAADQDINALAFDAAVAPRREPNASPTARDDRPTAPAGHAHVDDGLGVTRDPSPSKAEREIAAFGPAPDQATPKATDKAATTSGPINAANQQDTEAPIGARAARDNPDPAPREAEQPKVDREKSGEPSRDDPRKNGPIIFTGPAGTAASVLAGAAGTAKSALSALTGVANTINAPDEQINALRRSPAEGSSQTAPAQPDTAESKDQKDLDPFRPSTPGGPLANFFAAITPSGQERARKNAATQTPPNTQTPANPQGQAPQKGVLTERYNTFEARQQVKRDAKAIEGAEQAGQAALDALKALENGPAAPILQRIQSAAENHPGGIENVLEGMHKDGPYADLRKSFDAALAADEKLEAAFKNAETALASYGNLRDKITPLLSSHQNAQALSKKFQELDSELGEASWTIPGTKEGESMFKKLSDGAGEIFHKIAGLLRGASGAQASASASARPSPGF